MLRFFSAAVGALLGVLVTQQLQVAAIKAGWLGSAECNDTVAAACRGPQPMWGLTLTGALLVAASSYLLTRRFGRHGPLR